MRTGLAGVAAALVVAGCGTAADPQDATAEPTARSSAPSSDPAPVGAMPTDIPVALGPVMTGYAVTVLDDGHGPELCLGGVAESYPPQCGGPKLLGWDWADHAGDYEESLDTRWGDFAVTGTFDGTDISVTDVVAADEIDEPTGEDPDRDRFRTPCPEPAGGWQPIDPATTTRETQEETIRAANRIDGVGDIWVDQSINPAYDDPDDIDKEYAMNDPLLLVLNVRVTGDVAAAEATLRETWGGALCVSTATHTTRELRRIQTELYDLPGGLGASSGFDVVDAWVVYDDGSLQAWADRTYGEGVVRVGSALQDVP